MTEQADQNAALASAPGVVTIGAATFLIEKSTTAHVFMLYEWATEQARKRYDPIKEVFDALAEYADKIHPAMMQGIGEKAVAAKLSGEVPGELVTRALRSREGVAFALWVHARGLQPLTLQSCNELVTEDNRIDVYVQLDKATGANLINKAVIDAGFFPPASAPVTTG